MSYQNDREAYCLASIYNLVPRRGLPYVGTHNYDTGMYEPDHFDAPELLPDYSVKGMLTPDAWGNYYEKGTYEGQLYYQKDDELFLIWWNGIDSWYISAMLGTPGTSYWKRTSPTITGEYEPGGTAFGNAAVVIGRRCMILAHIIDHTNIIVEYNPDLKFIVAYHVTGTLTPNAAKNYRPDGEINEQPAYASSLREFIIWWDGIDSWIINEQWAGPDNPSWKRTDPAIVGIYAPYGGAVGIATVVAG